MFKEFKEFISRGNVIDLAVGVIIGGAFTAIVTSLVNDIVMPLISLITGGVNFGAWNVALSGGKDPVMLNLGTFAAAVLNFILVALVIFLIVRGINRFRRKPAPAKEKRLCPYCRQEIADDATRCPHCTSELR